MGPIWNTPPSAAGHLDLLVRPPSLAWDETTRRQWRSLDVAARSRAGGGGVHRRDEEASVAVIGPPRHDEVAAIACGLPSRLLESVGRAGRAGLVLVVNAHP